MSGTVDVGEVALAYDETGRGPAVVYAHGLTGSRANDRYYMLNDWSPLVAAGRRLIRYDARGHGESGGRPQHTDYTWRHLAQDLLAVLDRLAGPRPADVIGASMGCGTLLHAALSRPDRFARLVLLIPPTAWDTRPEAARINNELADLVDRRGLDFVLAAIEDAPLPPVLAQAPDKPRPAAIDERLYPHVMRGAAASDLPAPEALRALTHPTLILTWVGDPTHPQSTAEKLSELLPHARLHVSSDYADVLTWGERVSAFLDDTEPRPL
ncbi:alpha/beta fold hydrolase [Actinocrinis puniceicyclus]|uniref:Alpha/beta fold hydrolase n=1 Tax=Actinocrinis puniceicyclus TaxID=977794 RepID=A0A8J7WNW2_9ACTN|nr:alpha/beta fold hydrolase [Actinocrinis puniceicyclus]MBS2964190.1 alpha/beta fold hydrolase [Actinocrinis puniceicyclus]